MLSPQEVLTKLTTDEFISLCQKVPGKFEVIAVERNENLDPTIFIQLPSKECKVIH